MKKRYYLDTCIWLDLYEDRKGHNKEKLGLFAFKLLAKIKATKSTIVISEFLITELISNYSIKTIEGMLKPFEKNTEKIIVTSTQIKKAKFISIERNIPKGDVLHALIAKDHDLILITRDKHFKQLKDIVNHYKPEEII